MPTGIYIRTEYHKSKLKGRIFGYKFPKGHKPWNAGKKMPQEMKDHLSEYFKANPVSYWLGKKRGPHSEELKEKMSEAKKGKIPKNIKQIAGWNKDKKCPQFSGKNHWNWQDGKTSINEKIRNSLEYKLWRKAVFERDNYMCIWCKKEGAVVNADHIKPFAYYPKLRFAIDNGRTLCIECHKKTDTFAYKTKKNYGK